jgi:hypothetical protein
LVLIRHNLFCGIRFQNQNSPDTPRTYHKGSCDIADVAKLNVINQRTTCRGTDHNPSIDRGDVHRLHEVGIYACPFKHIDTGQ